MIMQNKTKQESKSPKSNSKNEKDNNGMESSQLMQLFEDQLKDIYWAEKALVKALPKMAKNATSEELIEALDNHLKETEGQVSRLEQVFGLIEKKAAAKKCDAMEGLIKEGESIMEECEEGPMRDAGIISAGQKIEHYEIASYGTLKTFASTLGLTEAAELLELTLEEEKTADETLTEVAVSVVNVKALEARNEDDK
jgi:ferritin-like metal-binding protein YciE